MSNWFFYGCVLIVILGLILATNSIRRDIYPGAGQIKRCHLVFGIILIFATIGYFPLMIWGSNDTNIPAILVKSLLTSYPVLYVVSIIGAQLCLRYRYKRLALFFAYCPAISLVAILLFYGILALF